MHSKIESNAKLFIKLDVIKKNYKYLSSFKNNVAASVKANCYGLGLKPICESLISQGCKNFFVADAQEAIKLRSLFKEINIFVLGGVQNIISLNLLVKNNIFIVINNKNDLKVVKKYHTKFKKKISCGIHFDTGMNRLGFGEKDTNLIIRSINEFLEPKLVMSHLSNSEVRLSDFNKIQLKRFNSIKILLSKHYDLKYSLTNSNGIFLGKKYCFDLARSGGLIFGLHLKNKRKNIKNVISLKAKIIQIRLLEQGSPIGYGSKYITKKKSKIATIGIGYADGLPRKYKGLVFLKGKKAKICGNISMDLTCIDLTRIKNVKVNDWVEVFGDNIPIENFANSCATITYDILSGLGNRIERIYLNS